ncbi:hypothetical protein C8J57DRAFT_1536486 [Mycena rebaudengoi]|nr:hypothetical protein C8J57DRAFT_1536486 [Mycena rebaudengoi]
MLEERLSKTSADFSSVRSSDVAIAELQAQSESVEVEDHMDYESALTLQIFSDINQADNPLETVVTSSSSDTLKSSFSPVDKGKGRAFEDPEDALLHAILSKCGEEPLENGTNDDRLKKLSAPFELLLRKAMTISDYMSRSAQVGIVSTDTSAPGVSVPSSSCVKAPPGKVLASVSERTLSGETDVKPISAPAVYQSDLDTLKMNDSTAICGVSDLDLQDPQLKSSYVGLPPLPGGRMLLPSYVKLGDEFIYDLTGGRVSFSLMKSSLLPMELSNAVAAIIFVKAEGGYINPSRVDPSRISAQATSADLSRYLLMDLGRVAICISPVMAFESFLQHGQASGKSSPKKWLTGVFHDQEYERLVALLGLAFCANTMYAQLVNGGVVFQSRLAIAKGTGTSKDVNASGVMSSQKGTRKASAPVPKTSVAFEDDIPLYDGRRVRIDFKKDLSRLSSILPVYEGEFPHGSLVVVGYTVTGWQAIPAATGDKIKHPHVGFNVLWVILLGER